LIVVGSYVPKSTLQLASLLEGANVLPVELNVKEIIEAARKDKIGALEDKIDNFKCINEIISKAVTLIDKAILAGNDVVLYTTREFLTGTTLNDAAAVSDTLTR
jgi:uncharacterized protein YgbK (DUF1537 family)